MKLSEIYEINERVDSIMREKMDEFAQYCETRLIACSDCKYKDKYSKCFIEFIKDNDCEI